MGARRTIVTGAGGFVGAALARSLLAKGCTATLVVRPGGDRWRLDDLAGDAEVLELDLRDHERVADAFGAVAPEWVFHLAAHGAYSWQDDAPGILATNVLGAAAVVEGAVAAGAHAVVLAGSSSEYGLVDHPPGEDELPRPNSAYAVSKVAATMFGGWAAREHGAAVTTLRLYSVYGPWEEPRRLVPAVVLHGRRGELPPLADPAIARDFVYIDDACDAFIRAANAARSGDAAVYNVASGRQTRLDELVETARDVFGVDAQPRWDAYPRRAWDTDVWVGDPSRAATDLGWAAQTGLGDGLRAFSAWLDEVPAVRGRYENA